jgi:choline dehydrogenase-like flavoprotein
MEQGVGARPEYDVVVIGSGAGGGTTVQVLTGLGLRVALLEAGPLLDPARDYKEHVWPYQAPHRGAGGNGEFYFGQKSWGYFAAPNGYWEIDGEPYTVARGSEFRWFRSRILGGRTNHYGRISLRFSDYDFRPHSTDGLGTDWPIRYEDLAPYYDKAEAFIGVFGTKEGIRSAPDGVFQPPPPPRAYEALIQRACGRLGLPCIPARLAVITRPLNGRPACHYCGQCGRGCMTASNYSSSQVQIFPALKTGKLTIIPNAMARELVPGPEGRLRSVVYIDKRTRAEREVRGRAVVLAASACESARLLLNSTSSRFPNGLANSSGTVGRFLTDTTGFGVSGYIPALAGMPKYNDDGVGGGHLYIPWWLYDAKNKDFPRGYHVELGGGFDMPEVGSFHGSCERQQGFGAALKQKIHDEYGCFVHLEGRGEMIPNDDSYMDLDTRVVDRYGIPVPRFHFRWNDSELKQVEHMRRTFVSVIEALGGKVTGMSKRISVGGEIIHEVGTIRMGNDPRVSVLNEYCQAHDVKNLFVADGGPLVSNADKNPTLTIIALAWRTAEYLAEQMRRGDV